MIDDVVSMFKTVLYLAIIALAVLMFLSELNGYYNSISTKIHRRQHASDIGCEYLGNSDNAPKIAFYQCNGELVTKIEEYPN
jgi:ascorbate-specific PTS system EIIC-type component UlaA